LQGAPGQIHSNPYLIPFLFLGIFVGRELKQKVTFTITGNISSRNYRFPKSVIDFVQVIMRDQFGEKNVPKRMIESLSGTVMRVLANLLWTG